MSDFQTPFRPAGPMISLLGSSTNTGAATLLPMSGDGSVLVFNRSSSLDAYLVYGPNSSVVAGTTLPVVGAGVPVGAGANVLPIPSRSLQTFTFSGSTFVSILLPSAGNLVVDIAQGDGA